MTPRTLLTTIGATALAFAVTIVAVAGSAPVTMTARAAVVALAAPEHRSSAPRGRGLIDDRDDSARRASWPEPCAIAV